MSKGRYSSTSLSHRRSIATYPGRSSTRGSGSAELHRRRNPSATSSSSMSNPRICWPSNVSGSPSASRSTGTTTPAAATDPVGRAVIAPLGHDRPGDRLARRHADSGEDAERERADHGGDREWSHGRPTPPRHEPDHHDDNGAGDQSDDSADDPGTAASLTDAVVPVPPNTVPAPTPSPRPTAMTAAATSAGSR